MTALTAAVMPGNGRFTGGRAGRSPHAGPPLHDRAGFCRTVRVEKGNSVSYADLTSANADGWPDASAVPTARRAGQIEFRPVYQGVLSTSLLTALILSSVLFGRLIGRARRYPDGDAACGQ
jgi:hypothetical protein